MLVAWPVLLTQAALVAVQPRAADECPTSRQVADALSTRMPGVLVPPDTQGPEVLLLVFSTPGAAAPSFSLVDQAGRSRLERGLAATPGAKPADCAALADTVALMVERYLQELEIQARPIPPGPRAPEPAPPSAPLPGPPWDVSVGGFWRPAEPGLGAAGLRLMAGRTLGSGRRLRLMVSAGVSGKGSWVTPGVSTDLRRFPLEAGVLFRILTGPGELEVGPTVGLDIIDAQAVSAATTIRRFRPGPEAGLLLGFRLALSPGFFVRLHGGGALAIVRYDFVRGRGQEVEFGTPRAYAHFGAAVGVSF